MFKNFTSAFKLVKNLDTIRQVITASYGSLIKLQAVLLYIEGQLSDTKLSVIISKYLPKIMSIVGLVLGIFEKYGPLVGVAIAPVTVLEDDLIDELDRSISELKNLLLV